MKQGPGQSECARARLARRLRTLRAQQGISQELLGQRADLHRTYVGAVERAERNVSLDNIERLAQALGVDIGDLLGKSELPATREPARR